MIGQRVSRYLILEKIGAGGMGVVYRARDERLERDVALKVLPPGIFRDEAARKRFRKEALALSKLNHPNIATIHDFDSQDGVDFLVMEFITGTTLSHKLRSEGLSEKEVISLGLQIASALEEAHDHGIVHRDLKPSNIFLTPKNQIKILDFGLAVLLKPDESADLTLSDSDVTGISGTLPYMAPEQLLGKPADTRSDIYSVGTVLFEMSTGSRPFDNKISTALSNDIIYKQPAPRIPSSKSLRQARRNYSEVPRKSARRPLPVSKRVGSRPQAPALAHHRSRRTRRTPQQIPPLATCRRARSRPPRDRHFFSRPSSFRRRQ